nr:hypothetical protein Iba_chr14aCG5550 [Ipomoea batatas]
MFDFPVKEGALPNCSGHAFNQEDLWKEVNGGQASVELKMKPHALKGKGATPSKKKATKEKSSSNFPLAKVAKKAKRKLEWWKIVKLRKLPKPPRVPKSKVTVRALLIPQEPALAADVEGENLTKVVSKIAKEVGGNVVEITEDSEATLYDPTAQQIRVDAQLAQQMAYYGILDHV